MKLFIKELREENRWTQKELADRVNNVQRNVSNWENGTSEPDCETLLKLAEVFNVSLDELFGRTAENLAYHALDPDLVSLIKKLTPEQRSAVKKLLITFIK